MNLEQEKRQRSIVLQRLKSKMLLIWHKPMTDVTDFGSWIGGILYKLEQIHEGTMEQFLDGLTHGWEAEEIKAEKDDIN
jgi:hypothetical protein